MRVVFDIDESLVAALCTRRAVSEEREKPTFRESLGAVSALLTANRSGLRRVTEVSPSDAAVFDALWEAVAVSEGEGSGEDEQPRKKRRLRQGGKVRVNGRWVGGVRTPRCESEVSSNEDPTSDHETGDVDRSDPPTEEDTQDAASDDVLEEEAHPLEKFVTGLVYRIVDRRVEDRRVQYLVKWFSFIPKKRTESWESRTTLLGDGCGTLLAVVDRWVAGGRLGAFSAYFKRWDAGRRLRMRDNLSGTCTLVAVQTLMTKLRVGKTVTTGDYESFKRECGIGSQDGDTWESLHRFLGRVVSNEGWLDFSVLKFNLYRGYKRNAEAFMELRLVDGLYLVGTTSSLQVGHCWILEIISGVHTCWEGDVSTPLESADWIDTVMFIRRCISLPYIPVQPDTLRIGKKRRRSRSTKGLHEGVSNIDE